MESFQEIVSRSQAINCGHKFYFTGKACPKGHVAKRYTSGARCVDCRPPIREKIIRDKNTVIQNEHDGVILREAALKNNFMYYFTGKRCRKGHLAQRLVSTKRCLDCAAVHSVRWYKKNGETIRQKYKNEFLEKDKKLREKIPSKRLVDSARNRAKEKNIPFNIKPKDVFIPESCPCCGVIFISIDEYREIKDHRLRPSIDRIIPELGYIPQNVIVICVNCNKIKGIGMPFELRRAADFMESLIAARNLVLPPPER